MAGQFVAMQKRDKAEAARIVQDEDRPVLGRQDEMIVPKRSGVRIASDDKASRHAEMNDKNLAVIQRQKEIFGPSADMDYAAAGQTARQVRREWNAQIRAVLANRGDDAAFEHGSEAARNGFDFG